MKARELLLVLLVSVCVSAESWAIENASSPSPYIDELREELHEERPPAPFNASGSYIQTLQQKILEQDAASGVQPDEGSYTKELQESLGKTPQEPSYTEQRKAILAPVETGGAIQAVHEGRSDLKPKMVGEIHHAIGLRYGASMNRDISASGDTASGSFDTLYGSNYAPDVTFFYEYQPWHSEWFGNLAIFGQLGVGYFHGKGSFKYALTNPTSSGVNFGQQSQTTFQFFSLPLTAGLSYRFNLLRILRPFVMGGGTLIGYYEGRNDGMDGHRGLSEGLYVSGGVSILLDWISRGSSWDLYTEHGVKHYYLTVDYSRLMTLAGAVNFGVSGIYAGMTFEF